MFGLRNMTMRWVAIGDGDEDDGDIEDDYDDKGDFAEDEDQNTWGGRAGSMFGLRNMMMRWVVIGGDAEDGDQN